MSNGENSDVNEESGGWDEILNELKKAAKSLMTLDITTEVTGADSKKISTKIDLIQGDISNSIDGAFLRDKKLAPIRDFHSNQVEKGQQIINGNVDVIVKLVNQLSQSE